MQVDWWYRRPRLKPFHRYPILQMSMGYEPFKAYVIITGDLLKYLTTLLNF
jgi:hypothetical protein